MRHFLTTSLLILSIIGIAAGGQRSALVTGHRGVASGPECTVVSAVMAFDQGADIIEIDVRTSSDGILVNFHDATLDRTTDGTGNLADFTLDQLKQLDAGSWKSPDFAGERIPTLTEMLNLAKTRGKGAFLDIKVATPAAVAAAISATEFNHANLTILTWSTSQATQFATALPDATIAYTPWNQPTTWDATYFDDMAALGIDAFAFWYASITRPFVHDAAATGMPVYTFTINQSAKAQELLDYGVSMFITDQAGSILDGVDWDTTFRIRSSSLQPNGSITLTWRAIAGDTYRVEHSDTMAPDSWSTLTTVVADSILPSYTAAPIGNRQFYRVVVP